MKPELHDIGFTDYQAIDCLNFSTAKNIKKCARSLNHAGDMEATTAMVLGTAVHTAILEPIAFKKWYKRAPENARRGSKAWKEVADKFPRSTILRWNEYQEVIAMRDSLSENADAVSILEGGYTEASITWTDEKSGLDLKCRIDKCLMTDDDALIVDLKTTQDASPRAMAYRMVTEPYYYLLQMAWYQRGFEAVFEVKPRVAIVAIEKSAGYPTAVYDIADADMELANQDVDIMLEKVVKARKEGGAGHYPRTFLELPDWYYNIKEEVTI